MLNDKSTKWLNKACFIFGRGTRYNLLIVRESLFWIFFLTGINEQALEISFLKLRARRANVSANLSLRHLNTFSQYAKFSKLFWHVKSKVIFSGFSLFKHTWNSRNTCTLLHSPRLPCYLQLLSYMRERYVVSFSCLVSIYAHVK